MVQMRQPSDPPGDDDEEIRVICSACYGSFAVEEVRVIPSYNDVLSAFVTTYRCIGKCWAKSIRQTRIRLARSNEIDTISAADFFERYGVTVDEYQRAAPWPTIRAAVLKLVERMEAGELELKLETKSTVSLETILKELGDGKLPGMPGFSGR